MELTTEMVWVLGILGLTIYLFVSEIVRVDVAAIAIMVLLGVTTVIPDHLVPSLVKTEELFHGFASNAVISIIAVMVIGAGLDRTGVMSEVARLILRVGGTTERRIIPVLSGTVAIISSFMQNVGAAALFLPVVSRISLRTGLPMSRLLMPMGFCAILGGTMTMVGSSPLILLNDLIQTSNDNLPAHADKLPTFELFAVAPVGLALILTGIVYFVLAGRYVLPAAQGGTGPLAGAGAVLDTMEYFRQLYGLAGEVFEARVPPASALANLSIESLESLLPPGVNIIALRSDADTRLSPARDVVVVPGATLALLGSARDVQAFTARHELTLCDRLEAFSDVLAPTQAGISEVVIPPGSRHIGRTLLELRLRKTYGLSVLAVYRSNTAVREGLRDLTLQSGDTLVLHSSWADLAAIEQNRDFVVVTSNYPHEDLRPHKVVHALAFFALALGLVLFTDLRLSVALLVGATGMVLTRVLTIDEAYNAVSWKTVFLLASLIPLGAAVEETGTAEWIATRTLELLGSVPHWVLQAVVAALATFFTLVMSNVGATVLLVPLAINIALQAGADPAVFALTVALATSNSFLIPTHQVNALIMGPAGYRVSDFLRAGGIMTVLFLVVMLVVLNVVF